MDVAECPTLTVDEKPKRSLRNQTKTMSEVHDQTRVAPPVPGRGSFLRWLVSGSVIVAVASIFVTFWSFHGQSADTARASTTEKPSEPVGHETAVKTVHPRSDATFQMTVEEPAFVEAYYQADLMSRVAGPVKYVEVAIGSRVKAGRSLVRIDVPDLEEDVHLKESMVAQRKRELALAKALEKTATAAVEFARSIIAEKDSDRLRAESMQSFRQKELRRFTGLAADKAVTADIVDERTQYYEAAIADVKSAIAAVEKARAGLSEAQAKLEAAQADVSLKSAMVDVAEKDLARARATLSFADITAPFDGVVTRRNVDPGAFVQSAASGRPDPILTVARTDIVTVYMKVPDNYAPYVTPDTEAIIRLGVLPDLEIRGKVTRSSESLLTGNNDRTLRVEVDLFNRDAEAYQRLVERAKAEDNAGFKDRKLPLFPTVSDKPSTGLDGRLMPGMYGTMKLVLRKFGDATLVPSSALVSQGGRYFIYLVKGGKAVRTLIDQPLDDGRLAKVVIVETVDGRTVRRSLSRDETVIVSNQGELSDGQAVKVAPSEW
jgi:multidrug efflux pump subunit AcrA (membrane-fusion protein)